MIIFALVWKKGREEGLHLQATYGLLTAGLFLVPLLTLRTLRSWEYARLRGLIIAVFTLAVWHYGLKASTVLSERPVGTRALPLLLLLRSQVLIMLW